MLITRVFIMRVYLFLQLNISAGIEGCLVRACLEKTPIGVRSLTASWPARFMICSIYIVAITLLCYVIRVIFDCQHAASLKLCPFLLCPNIITRSGINHAHVKLVDREPATETDTLLREVTDDQTRKTERNQGRSEEG